MAGISTSTGLISGINTDEIVRQMMAIERQPIKKLETRIEVETSRQTALTELNAKLLMMKTSINRLKSDTFFDQVSAESSHPEALDVSVATGTTPGTYQFHPVRTASAFQAMSRGFADPMASVGAGTIRLGPAASKIDGSASVELLNGGAGVSRGSIRITQGNGVSATVDLSTVQTMDDVVQAIKSAGSLTVDAAIENDRLVITDLSGGAGELRISEVGMSQTAADLGILKTDAGGQIVGDMVNRMGDGTALASLNDGLGVRSLQAIPDLRIDAGGASMEIDVSGMSTLGEFIDAVNNHADNGGAVTAKISSDGKRIELVDNTGGAPSVTALNSSMAAEDLGLTTGAVARDTLTGGQVWSELGGSLLKNLNGGSGVAGGSIRLTDRAGNTATVDLTTAESLSDVIERINTNGVANISASVADNGVSLVLSDTSGGGGNIVVEDINSTAAADLGIATAGVADDVLQGGSIARQSIGEATQLADVNGGVFKGQFRLVDRNGVEATVDLRQDGDTTIGDVIKEINTRGTSITARINDTGDGIVLEDTSGGSGIMRVEDLGGGTTAADLGIKGQASADTPSIIDGSFTKVIEVEAGDTLQQVAEAIEASGAGVTASVVNVGGAMPYRLNILSDRSGAAGGLTIDGGSTLLDFNTVQQGRDAMIMMGSGPGAVAMTSSDNTFQNVIDGMDLTVKSPTATPVSVTVSGDTEKIVDQFGKIVSSFNEIIGKINDNTKYNAEKEERGLLMGDPAVLTLERQLRNVVYKSFGHLDLPLRNLQDLGVSFLENGKMEFDREQFTSMLADNPDAVRAFFTAEAETDADGNETVAGGFGEYIEGVIDRLTDSQHGMLTRRSNTYGKLVEQYNDRIDDLEGRINRKEIRIRKEFLRMEMTLAKLRDQSNAIANFPQFSAPTGGGGGGMGGLM